MTQHAAAADLRSRLPLVIQPGSRALVPTGVWISSVDWDVVPKGAIPELQIRARSGLAFRHGITLMNGVGTIDADYPDEIGVLLWNTGSEPFEVKVGDRIAQMILALAMRLPDAAEGERRTGGFGSTGQGS